MEFGTLEIEQKGQLQAGDGQITEHLGEMRLIERAHDLGVCNHKIVHNKIGCQGSNELTLVMYGKLLLLLRLVPTFPQFDYQRILIELLIQTRFQLVQYGHRRADNVFAEILVNHTAVIL